MCAEIYTLANDFKLDGQSIKDEALRQVVIDLKAFSPPVSRKGKKAEHKAEKEVKEQKRKEEAKNTTNMMDDNTIKQAVQDALQVYIS